MRRNFAAFVGHIVLIASSAPACGLNDVPVETDEPVGDAVSNDAAPDARDSGLVGDHAVAEGDVAVQGTSLSDATMDIAVPDDDAADVAVPEIPPGALYVQGGDVSLIGSTSQDELIYSTSSAVNDGYETRIFAQALDGQSGPRQIADSVGPWDDPIAAALFGDTLAIWSCANCDHGQVASFTTTSSSHPAATSIHPSFPANNTSFAINAKEDEILYLGSPSNNWSDGVVYGKDVDSGFEAALADVRLPIYPDGASGGCYPTLVFSGNAAIVESCAPGRGASADIVAYPLPFSANAAGTAFDIDLGSSGFAAASMLVQGGHVAALLLTSDGINTTQIPWFGDVATGRRLPGSEFLTSFQNTSEVQLADNGSLLYFIDNEHLFRYSVADGSLRSLARADHIIQAHPDAVIFSTRGGDRQGWNATLSDSDLMLIENPWQVVVPLTARTDAVFLGRSRDGQFIAYMDNAAFYMPEVADGTLHAKRSDGSGSPVDLAFGVAQWQTYPVGDHRLAVVDNADKHPQPTYLRGDLGIVDLETGKSVRIARNISDWWINAAATRLAIMYYFSDGDPRNGLYLLPVP